MNDYRPLTSEEIEVLKSNDCWAEDWTSVNVSENFKPNFMHRVMLYGEVNIGGFDKNVEVSQGFVKHSGINNATLRNVTIGDDCLIETWAISSTTTPSVMIATFPIFQPWRPQRELPMAKEIW